MHNGHRVDTRCSTLKTTCIMSLCGNDEKYKGMENNDLNCYSSTQTYVRVSRFT